MQEQQTRNTEIGFVTKTRGSMCSIKGLPSVRVHDILETQSGALAMVTSLDDDLVTATLLASEQVSPGDSFTPVTAGFLFEVNEALFGRVISPVGVVRDGGDETIRRNGHNLKIDRVAPGIDERVQITRQCLTGTSICDLLVPLGKGQRQLIYGPPKSGKRAFVLQTLVNQHAEGAICIYAVCGRSPEEIRTLSAEILSEDRAPTTIIIAASSDDPSSLITLAPSVAFAVAEVFVAEGKDVFVVLDDLGTHAKYLREIALLEKRLPGRESYPGDVFYQHAHLMERSGAFTSGGTLTLLPILENETESTRDLVSTNLVACTDGNFAFSADKHAVGTFPAINLDDSITRAGRETQGYLQKQLATKLNQLLGWYRNQVVYSDFATISDPAIQGKTKQGAFLEEMLKQTQFNSIPIEVQSIFLALSFTSLASEVDAATLRNCKSEVLQALQTDEQFAALRDQAQEAVEVDDFIQQVEKHVVYIKRVCS